MKSSGSKAKAVVKQAVVFLVILALVNVSPNASLEECATPTSFAEAVIFSIAPHGNPNLFWFAKGEAFLFSTILLLAFLKVFKKELVQ